MARWRGLTTAIAAIVLAGTSVPLLASAASAAPTAAASSASTASAASASCRSSAHPALAARLAQDISHALRGRVSVAAVEVDDPGQSVLCRLDNSMHFDSASVVKVIILSALLRKAQEEHRSLTRTETDLAYSMITESDNDAASALWDDAGRYYLQHFLDLARMNETHLGPGGAWGLTQITAGDETVLLELLLDANSVLNSSSRAFVLHLMAEVIPSQRWGVPDGAPTSLTVHVKNGWLPLSPYGWRINSIGCFTGQGGGYSIVVLTQDNPSMIYGIDTIQAVARAVNQDLNPAAKSRVQPEPLSRSQQTPDEVIPAAAGLS
jgi:Beta-lactamase enzyme family